MGHALLQIVHVVAERTVNAEQVRDAVHGVADGHQLGGDACVRFGLLSGDHVEPRVKALTHSTGIPERLREVLRCEGASFGHAPGVHDVVETDTDEGWETEIFKWYDQEHMPGLATVPGCILARRLLNLDHAPRSYACYDLVARDTLGSPPWLAVRGTAWSDICRPHFTNTSRTLFEQPNA